MLLEQICQNEKKQQEKSGMLEIKIRVLAPQLESKVQNITMEVDGCGRTDKQVSELQYSQHTRWMIYFIINIIKMATRMGAIVELIQIVLNGRWAICIWPSKRSVPLPFQKQRDGETCLHSTPRTTFPLSKIASHEMNTLLKSRGCQYFQGIKQTNKQTQNPSVLISKMK